MLKPRPQKIATQEYLYTALTQMMQHRSLKDLSITAVTAKAGVSRTAFYHNYTELSDIFSHHLTDLFADVFTRVKTADVHTHYEVAQIYFAFFGEHHTFLELLLRDHLDYLFYEHFTKSLTIFFAEENKFDHASALDTKYFTRYHGAGLYFTLLQWINTGRTESVLEMATFVTHVANDGTIHPQ